MDYSLLLSAEKYSAKTLIKDDGGMIDPDTPVNHAINADEEANRLFS